LSRRPVIAVSTCIKYFNDEAGLPFHAVAGLYVAAVAEFAGGLPLLVPALGDGLDRQALLAAVDGLLLTGSLSNVHPSRYGHDDDEPCPPHDELRDATTLPLVREALALKLPVLSICRGLQELNVALGGTLHPRVHRVPDHLDHRADASLSLERQFAAAHPVALATGGRLRDLAGADRLMVNSLHGQGIDRLAPGLAVEATAPDGLIEAVRVEGHPFAIGVQWHPEWAAAANPFSRALFAAFGAAAGDYRRA
jgi:putative glutamine amidotransferase